MLFLNEERIFQIFSALISISVKAITHIKKSSLGSSITHESLTGFIYQMFTKHLLGARLWTGFFMAQRDTTPPPPPSLWLYLNLVDSSIDRWLHRNLKLLSSHPWNVAISQLFHHHVTSAVIYQPQGPEPGKISVSTRGICAPRFSHISCQVMGKKIETDQICAHI